MVLTAPAHGRVIASQGSGGFTDRFLSRRLAGSARPHLFTAQRTTKTLSGSVAKALNAHRWRLLDGNGHPVDEIAAALTRPNIPSCLSVDMARRVCREHSPMPARE